MVLIAIVVIGSGVTAIVVTSFAVDVMNPAVPECDATWANGLTEPFTIEGEGIIGVHHADTSTWVVRDVY